MKNKNNTQAIISLVLIIIVSFSGFLFYVESSNQKNLSILQKATIEAIWLILVYLCGLITWTGLHEKWLLTIWNWVYLISLLFLLGGTIVSIIGNPSFFQTGMFRRTKGFPRSPMVFAILYVLYKVKAKNAVSK